MCGRYALISPPTVIRDHFGYLEQPDFPPRAAILPTEPIAIVRAADRLDDPTPRFGLVRWGFVPGFVKDYGSFRSIINAKAEDLLDRASFRNAVRRRRCLIPADAFYLPGRPSDEPCWARRSDGKPLALAGLFETWLGADGSEIDTGCIVTVEASDKLRALQPRMPAIIETRDFETWLRASELEAGSAMALLRPAPAGTLELVATAVGGN